MSTLTEDFNRVMEMMTGTTSETAESKKLAGAGKHQGRSSFVKLRQTLEFKKRWRRSDGPSWALGSPAVTDRRYRVNLPGCEPHGPILADGPPG